MNGARANAPSWGRWIVIGVPLAWLALFFLAPFLMVLKISVAESVSASPPYTPLFGTEPDGKLALQATVGNYALLVSEPLYLKAYLNSIRIAGIATLVCLAVGYPMAYAIARAPTAWRAPLLMLVVLPFWTSFLIRVYAWIGLLKDNGLVNNLLMKAGLIEKPLPLLYNDFAVVLGIVYSYLPFMVLPLYAALARMDGRLLEAAADLGCRPMRAFWKVTWPLSRPGAIAGCLLVFIPAVGEFVVPDLLGGANALMIGKLLWTEFFGNRDWPVAAASAAVMVALLIGPMLWLLRDRAEERDVS